MDTRKTVIGLVLGIGAGAVIIYALMRYREKKSKDNFTRTCVTADTNCQFVRSPVDYVYKETTEIPTKQGRDFPHLMGDYRDKTQPLENNSINLIQDEMKLWNPDLLWKQYEHDWAGCGNGKPYIVNDEKTRFSLAEVGDVWAERQLNSEKGPLHGSQNVAYPALCEQDAINPEPFEPLYGGSQWLHNKLGD